MAIFQNVNAEIKIFLPGNDRPSRGYIESNEDGSFTISYAPQFISNMTNAELHELICNGKIPDVHFVLPGTFPLEGIKHD